MKFGVITSVPDPEMDDGNLAAAIVYRMPSQVRLACMVQGRQPVFDLGEILVLDGEYGREISGRGRKPSKWGVTCEYFDDINAAIERAQTVMGQSERFAEPQS